MANWTPQMERKTVVISRESKKLFDLAEIARKHRNDHGRSDEERLRALLDQLAPGEELPASAALDFIHLCQASSGKGPGWLASIVKRYKDVKYIPKGDKPARLRRVEK